jgi:MFS family permease
MEVTFMDFIELWKAFVLSVIPIMVALDAPGTLPIYVGLTEGLEREERKRIVRQSILTAFFVTVGFILVGLTSFTNAVARTGALFNVIPILARDRLGLTAGRIGLGLALASLVGLVLAYPAGVVVDHYGRKAVIVPATMLAGLSLVLFLVAPTYGWFLVACVAWSVAAGIGGAAPAAYAADVAPPGMNAAAMSTYRMLSDLGYVAGPLALGLAADLVGADLTLEATAVLLVVVALLFARLAPETHRGGRA